MQTAYIGMGSNVAGPAGSPEETLALASLQLGSLGRLVGRSSLYSTEPVGYADQPRFLNAVVALETELDAHALLAALLRIEAQFGRDRSAGVRNGPRSLDLDILIFGDQTIREQGLEVPHPRMGERAFVLIPLVEVASKIENIYRPKAVVELLHTFLERSLNKPDAVIPVKSAVWRSLDVDAYDDSGDAERAGSGTADADRRG